MVALLFSSTATQSWVCRARKEVKAWGKRRFQEKLSGQEPPLPGVKRLPAPLPHPLKNRLHTTGPTMGFLHFCKLRSYVL